MRLAGGQPASGRDEGAFVEHGIMTATMANYRESGGGGWAKRRLSLVLSGPYQT